MLLVGGDGFLGRHVAAALLAAGRRVTTLSRGNHPPVEGAERLLADRLDAASLAAALGGRRFDLTVDLAAYDARAVETLWRVPGAALGRTVMVSTGQVYMVTEGGPAIPREADSRRPLMREPAAGSPDHPQWAYGIGKRAAESVLLSLRRHDGVRAVILRVPVLQGEGDPTLRLWAWLERLLDGDPVLLPDRGRRATRFLDVADVARLVERIAGGLAPRAAVYNLAAPRVTSLGRFLSLAARAAGVNPRFVSVAATTLAAEGLDLTAWPYAGRWSSVLDPRRARRELGFTATPPEDYLPRVVRWHLEHRPRASHPGYAQRPAEIALAARQRSARAAVDRAGVRPIARQSGPA